MTRDEIILFYAKELGRAREALSDYHDRVAAARKRVAEIEAEFSAAYSCMQCAEADLANVLDSPSYQEAFAEGAEPSNG